MKDVIHTLAGGNKTVCIREVDLMEVYTALQLSQIFNASGREVIQPTHRFTTFHQCMGQM